MQHLSQALADACQALEGHVQLTPTIHLARQERWGDLSIAAPLALARGSGRQPREIAHILANALNASTEHVRASAEAPGYVNFEVTPECATSYLGELLQSAEAMRPSQTPCPQPLLLQLDFDPGDPARQHRANALRQSLQALASFLRVPAENGTPGTTVLLGEVTGWTPDMPRILLLKARPHERLELGVGVEPVVKLLSRVDARHASAMKMAHRRGITPSPPTASLSSLEERALRRQLLRLPFSMVQSWTDQTPSHLFHGVVATARAFHDFYDRVPVLSPHTSLAAARLGLMTAAATALDRARALLDSSPKK